MLNRLLLPFHNKIAKKFPTLHGLVANVWEIGETSFTLTFNGNNPYDAGAVSVSLDPTLMPRSPKKRIEMLMQGNSDFVMLSRNSQPPGFVEYLLEQFCTKKKKGFVEIDFSNRIMSYTRFWAIHFFSNSFFISFISARI